MSFSTRSVVMVLAASCAVGSLSIASTSVLAAPVDHTTTTNHKVAVQSKDHMCKKLVPVHYQPLGKYNDAWKTIDVAC